MILLDTNVLSALRRPERVPTLVGWMRAQTESDLHLSAISIAEIERVAALQDRRNPRFAADLRTWLSTVERQYTDRVLPVDAEVGRLWGCLSARLGHSGNDLWIAAIALVHDATLATGDADFAPTGVRLVNPFV